MAKKISKKERLEQRRKNEEMEWEAKVAAWNDPNIITEVRDPNSPFEPVEFKDKDGKAIPLEPDADDSDE